MKFMDIDNLSTSGIDEEAELIPLLTPEDEEEMNYPWAMRCVLSPNSMLKKNLKSIGNF